MSVIDDHLARFSGDQLAALTATVETIRRALPGAVEVISYGMPTFKAGDAKGPAVIGLDGFTRHNSLFPYSGSIPTQFADELGRYEQTKGSIHFPVDRAFPATLLKRILKARIREINASYPKPNGEFRQYDGTGTLTTRGRIRPDGTLRT